MPDTITPCPNCGGNELYTTQVHSAGGYGPQLLPGLGGFFWSAYFDLVACGGCGLIRFFASADAKEKLAASSKWTRCVVRTEV